MLLKYFGQQRAIAHISEYRKPDIAAGQGAQIQIEVMKILFRVIQKDQTAGSLRDDRLCKRRSDRAAGSREQNAAFLEKMIHERKAFSIGSSRN
jgi:hypothetical protein